jgi:hypothetical protein
MTTGKPEALLRSTFWQINTDFTRQGVQVAYWAWVMQ